MKKPATRRPPNGGTMPKSPRTKPATVNTPDEDSADVFVRDCLAVLNGEADRVALRIILGNGVFNGEDGADEMMAGAEALSEDYRAIQKKLNAHERRRQAITWTEEQDTWFQKFEDLTVAAEAAIGEGAYMLGVAVGRRIGGVR